MQHVPITNAALESLGVLVKVLRGTERNLYVFMKNYTAERANVVTTNGVHNGADVRRKHFKDQLPLGDDKRSIRMTGIMSRKAAVNA